jgi:hypothetical protein
VLFSSDLDLPYDLVRLFAKIEVSVSC